MLDEKFESIVLWVVQRTSTCALPRLRCQGSHAVKRNEHSEELIRGRMKEMKRPQTRKVVCTGMKTCMNHVLRLHMNRNHGTPGRFRERLPSIHGGIQVVDAIARRIAGNGQVQPGLVHPGTQAPGSTAPRGRRISTAHVVGGGTSSREASTRDGGSVPQASCAPPRFILLPVLVGGTGRCCIV